MIINKKDKGYETRSDKPNSNWTDEDMFVVADGTVLANKIIENYPYYNFILNENGDLFDIEQTERPIIKRKETLEEKVGVLEEENLTKTEEITELDFRLANIELGL